jgi:hypothetical protein
MTDNRAFLTNFVPTGSENWSVSGIGETSLTVAGQGDVSLCATVNGERLYGTLRGVLYVPGLGINLYSIGTATDAGLKVVFANDTVSFSQDGVVIMEGEGTVCCASCLSFVMASTVRPPKSPDSLTDGNIGERIRTRIFQRQGTPLRPLPWMSSG